MDWTNAGQGHGVSLRSAERILEAHQLAPHRVRTFKLSNDPKFADKLKDIVGLYVDPPDHAVVLSVDEKSFHFTPTSASWLNAVEGFFAKLTRRRLQRGIFRSVDELKRAINCFIADTNGDPNPSSGPPISVASSLLSNAGNKR